MSRSRRSGFVLAKFRSHVRHNVVGYVALFVALGPAAYATHHAVNSANIINGQVKNEDLANNAVGTGKVTDNSLLPNDIKPNSLGGGRIANNTLTAQDINEGSLPFVSGPGRTVHRRVDVAATKTLVLLRNIEGFGQLEAECFGATGGEASSVYYRNTTASTTDLTKFEVGRHGEEGSVPFVRQVGPNSGAWTIGGNATTPTQAHIVQLGKGAGSNGKLATLLITSFNGAHDANDGLANDVCRISVSVLSSL